VTACLRRRGTGQQPYRAGSYPDRHFAAGFFLFNHSCGTTLARPVAEFQDLYDGPLFASRATGSEECPGYCLRQEDLRGCPAECECASVRAIIQIILAWPGKGDRQGVGQLPHLIG